MATSKKKSAPKTSVGWRVSWRRMIIFASFAVNIGFLVLFITLMTTNVLDGVLMPAGLDRYCSTRNDEKFATAKPKIKALREYVCDRPEAHPYFKEGLQKYLDSKYLSTY
jgi:hypothetical protein